MEQRFKAVHDALKKTTHGKHLSNIISGGSLIHPSYIKATVSTFAEKDLLKLETDTIARLHGFIGKMEDKKAKQFLIKLADPNKPSGKMIFDAVISDGTGKTIMESADFRAFTDIVKKRAMELPTFEKLNRPDITESELLCQLITIYEKAFPEDTDSLSTLKKQLDELNKEELHNTVLAQQAEIDRLKEMIDRLQKDQASSSTNGRRRVAFAEGTKEDNPSPGKKPAGTTKEAKAAPAKKVEVADAEKAAPTKKGKTDLKEKGKEKAALAEESTDDEEIPPFIVSVKPDPDAYLGSQQTPSGSITLTEGGTLPLDD